mgnify:CR=1 FL=1
MENLILNMTYALLFAFFASRFSASEYRMLCVRVRKFVLLAVCVAAFSSVLFAAPAYAEEKGLFTDLIQKGSQIFVGVRNIVYVVAGFGIIGVAVGGFFGNLNWKWLGAIIIGLMVIALTTEILRFVADDGSFSIEANAQSQQ